METEQTNQGSKDNSNKTLFKQRYHELFIQLFFNFLILLQKPCEMKLYLVDREIKSLTF